MTTEAEQQARARFERVLADEVLRRLRYDAMSFCDVASVPLGNSVWRAVLRASKAATLKALQSLNSTITQAGKPVRDEAEKIADTF